MSFGGFRLLTILEECVVSLCVCKPKNLYSQSCVSEA
jgi:hypothetical protein